MRRLVDILSIKHKNLWGEKNKFQQNFYKPGTGIYYSTPNNLGTQLSILSSIIFCGAPLVAYEIFSENYTLINNTAINGYELNDPISLSGYNYEWGWGLIAPRGVSGVMISDYYRFYNYIPVFEDSYYNNIIDWDNTHTTLQFTNSSFNEWSKDSGIMQNLLSYELTKGLRLFLSGSDIVYNN